jgi:hypothetical protein
MSTISRKSCRTSRGPVKLQFNKGAKVLDKTYRAGGKTHGGKMFWGVAVAMKNATQQSTKTAIDANTAEFTQDINKSNLSRK